MSEDKIQSIQEFCDRHGACRQGRDWAETTCNSLHDVWRWAQSDWLVWVSTRPNVLPDRELRLFAVWSARQVEYLMSDGRSVAAIDVAERHARGEATDEELSEARSEALAAVRESARSAARSAAWSAAWSAAEVAAYAAASSAAEVAAYAAASEAQANWLRTNTRPDFSAKER